MSYDLLLIGSSAGGVDAFRRLFRLLPKNFPLPIVIIHHVMKGARVSQQAVYGSATQAPIYEIEDKMQLKPGHIYFAPPDYHVLVEKDLTASLDYSDAVNFSRPSIDVTYLSAAEEFGGRVIALLLTGASDDGARGLQQLAENKSYTVVQSPEDAQVPFMPEASLRLFKPNFVGTIEEIASHVTHMLGLSHKSVRFHEPS